MSGLLGTLNLGTRALATQSQGLAVAGQNLANVNNAAYTRQRLRVQSEAGSGDALDAGGGVSAVTIERVHDALIQRQVLTESSTGASWSARQSALESLQSSLGETIGASAAAGDATGPGSSLATELDGLFNGFQSLAADPSSLSQRGALLGSAKAFAADLNRTDARLADIGDSLNESVVSQVGDANDLLQSIADLNGRILHREMGGGNANELRDLRQEKLESLAGLANLEAVEDAAGVLNVTVGGQVLVTGETRLATLVAVDAGGGRRTVGTSNGDPLTLTGGSLHGTIETRDGALATLRGDLDRLAATVASEVNALHRAGFDLKDGTGADFFLGTTAADLRVNPDLISDPARIQVSGQAGAPGNNEVALSLAALATKSITGLGGQTFSGAYARTVTDLAESLATANTEVEDQAVLSRALQARRDSVSGVSIDEEMTDLVKYQKAFQASARVVSIIDGMLDEILNLKR